MVGKLSISVPITLHSVCECLIVLNLMFKKPLLEWIICKIGMKSQNLNLTSRFGWQLLQRFEVSLKLLQPEKPEKVWIQSKYAYGNPWVLTPKKNYKGGPTLQLSWTRKVIVSNLIFGPWLCFWSKLQYILEQCMFKGIFWFVGSRFPKNYYLLPKFFFKP